MKDPDEGYSVVSSPRDCMMEKAMRPMTPNPMRRDAGPPEARAPPAPTRRPGPMIPGGC